MKNQKSQKTALYRHYDKNNDLLYVGISLSSIKRYIDHKNNSMWTDEAVLMRTEFFDTRNEALIAEKLAIKLENPKHNIQHNDGSVTDYVSINEVIQVLLYDGHLASNKIEEKIKPSHGGCCTCQDCGHDHDSCICCHNELLTKLLSIKRVVM